MLTPTLERKIRLLKDLIEEYEILLVGKQLTTLNTVCEISKFDCLLEQVTSAMSNANMNYSPDPDYCDDDIEVLS